VAIVLTMSTICIPCQANIKKMSFLTTSGALDPSNQRWWNKTKEVHIIMAQLTQASYLLVIINLLSSRGFE
jgi:hypothetical protein